MKSIHAGSALLVLVTLVVVAVIAGGLWLVGSPARQRLLRLDERRIDDLQRIASQIEVYWTRHGALPKQLDALSAEPGLTSLPVDPSRNQPYSYRAFDKRAYELCATFDEASEDAPASLWAHDAGLFCFEREVAPAVR